ncbi:MAG: bifunctional riboflavin kinase/FAD synthetase [Roseburia sp.]|nr:bifunctional riboflavin kinase/FAD synthetase [Roseburia sp.]MCM1279904.1 bifunctional riboflavin kinase/FAD synthetase [Robinsoniella sp.]
MMKLIKDTKQFHINEETAVAIGKFDGVHLGHRTLLQKILEAKALGLKAAVFTFTPSPGVYFTGKTMEEITTRKEKRAIFAKMGIDYLVEYPFDWETANLLPEAFIRHILLQNMSAHLIVAGEDVSFGRQGKGDAGLLGQLGRENGFTTKIIPKICHEGKVISSTYARSAIKEGNMELAKALLGEPYFLEGIVVKGNQFGRTMGMPTINLIPSKEKLLPPNGVYFSHVEYEGNVYRGVTNIGRKPTVGDENPIGVETYLYDFSKVIYGASVRVSLLHYERAEQKFESLLKLKEAIEKNIADGKEYFINL